MMRAGWLATEGAGPRCLGGAVRGAGVFRFAGAFRGGPGALGRTGLIAGVCLLLAACASTPIHVVELPEREADLYPTAQEHLGIVIAVDEIRDPGRSQRYFGVDFPGRDILPLKLIVSNHGQQRVGIRPQDVLLLKDRQVHDPMPSVEVAHMLPRRQRARGDEADEIDAYFRDLTLRERIIAPGETAHGVMFFQLPEQEQDRDRWGMRMRHSEVFRHSRLFPTPHYELRVAVTALEDETRLLFGPFSVGP